MLVYRLEHKYSGQGPFGTSWMRPSRFPRTYRPPCPYADYVPYDSIKRSTDTRCGTISLVQLFAVWFQDPQIDLEAREHDYVVSFYATDEEDVMIGDHQCCFHRALSQKVEQHDMEELRHAYNLYEAYVPEENIHPTFNTCWHLTSHDFLKLDAVMLIPT